LAGEGLFQRRSFRRRGLIPRTVIRGSWMNVVRGIVVVLDPDILPSHHAQNMRMILADLLVYGRRVLGNIKGAIAQTFFHINEYVRQLTAIGNDRLRRVVAFARGILAYVDLLRLLRRSLERHRALYRSGRCGI